MRVLVTGGFGLVGRSVTAELIGAGHSVRVFDTPRARGAGRLLRAAGAARRRLQVVRGDLCNVADVGEAVREIDAVIHLGALIPPAADRNPRYAGYVNLGGTVNLIRALESTSPGTRLVFASSVAIYGDRRGTPAIRVDDPPNPGTRDAYARQKLAAEEAVSGSRLPWVILRLTYIVSTEKLRTDPLMFSMPLETRIETCSARDAARALVAAVRSPEATGRVFNVAGGARCRTTYRDYLRTMMALFGVDRPLPDDAFSTEAFHCGYMDTTASERILRYQRETLRDYYRAVGRRVRLKRTILTAMPVVRALVRRSLLRSSRWWRDRHAERDASRRPAQLLAALRAMAQAFIRPLIHSSRG